jgi:hypothetical protein
MVSHRGSRPTGVEFILVFLHPETYYEVSRRRQKKGRLHGGLGQEKK